MTTSVPSSATARTLVVRAAMLLTLWLAAVHLAAAADLPEGGEVAEPLGPACVGCHHGADDEPLNGPAPDVTGALPLGRGERAALASHHGAPAPHEVTP